ncbi:MuF-C-terminal domain-containing protein [Sphingobium sp. CAP-1]|uniref:MuF-C-terminal domain-containing protein n=1 Tax=Sphingobium sp. CAP-1 TaxID=2676077 RepID=UPI0012BB3908|nr:acetyltransferase [Sphingobium sp. CAP-1]QGP79998.1 acetyltransferase [Sphingobium sp. CAP-1]
MTDGFPDYLDPAGSRTTEDDLVDYLRNIQRTEMARLPDPDRAARTSAVARQYGVTPTQADADLDDWEKRRRIDGALATHDAYPAIGRWAGQGNNAAIAADDYDNLGLFGKAFYTLKGVGSSLVGGTYDYLIGGSAGFIRGLSETAEANSPIAWAERKIFGGSLEGLIGSGADTVQKWAKNKAKDWEVRSGNHAIDAAMSGVRSAPLALGSLGAALIGGPTAGASFAGASVAGQEYANARDAGLPAMAAQGYALNQGAIELITEKLPIGRLVGDVAGKSPFAKTLLRQMIAEIPGEQAATFLQDLNEQATLHPEKTMAQFWAERPAAAADTLIATVAGAGFTTAIASASSKTATVIDKMVDRRRQAAQAQANSAALDEIAAATGKSKLTRRDPDALASLVQQLGEDAGAHEAFIPGEAAMSYMQLDGYGGELDAWADQIAEAHVTGGDVVIPIGDLTRIVATPAWPALKDDIRLSAGGMSMREAQTFDEAMADVMAELSDRMADEERAARALNVPRDKLFQSLVDKLSTAGHSPSMARQNAEIWTQRAATRAARMGRELTGTEYDGLEIRQVLPANIAAAQKADQLDMAISVMKRQKDASQNLGPSLMDFIARGGGIVDTGGDLKAMGADQWHRGKPGKRKLVKDQGELLDDGGLGENEYGADAWAQRAWEAGYFPDHAERPAANDLLDAIAEGVAGRDRHLIAREKSLRDAAEELRALLENRGVDPDTASRKDIRSAVDSYAAEQAEGDGFNQSPADKRAWARMVDAIFRGDPVGSGPARLGRTPSVLVALGLPAGDMVMQKAKVARARREHPEVPLSVWHDLPDLLSDPRAAVPSGKGDGSIVVAVNAIDRAGDRIIVPVIASAQDGAVVLSVYGKADGDNYVAKIIKAAEKAGESYYVKEGLADALVAQAPGDAASHAPIASEVPARPRKPLLSRRDIVKKSLDQSSDDKQPRGRISFPDGKPATAIIELFQGQNQSTFLHETGHLWLEELREDAADPDAPQQIRDEWQRAQDWFAQNGHPLVDSVIPVEAHELWARGVERYLMEGKAPSPGLRRLFQTFKAWLVSLYGSVSRLQSPITDEIRGVMDRLIATDQELADAVAAQHLEALFPDRPASMSAAEYAAYQDLAATARDAAQSHMLAKTMNAVKRRVGKEWREREEDVRQDVTERVDALPEFRALRMARETPLDTQWIKDTLGEDAPSMLPKDFKRLHREGGVNPDEMAELAGYRTGDEMVRALMGIEIRRREMRENGDKRSVRKALIDQDVEALMLERFGDPFTDGSIEQEALAAVQSDELGAVMGAELRVLGRMTGQRVTPYSVAKSWAEQQVTDGRVRDVASRSAIIRYERAAAKAGRAAMDAVIANDHEEAFRQKQSQMLNNALVAAARRGADQVDEAVKRLEKWAKRRTVKGVDQDYLERAQLLLEQVEMKERTQRSLNRQESFEAWAAARKEEGYDVIVPPSFAESIGKTHWSRLKVGQLLALNDAVVQIIHLGRHKQSLLDAKEERDYQAVVSDTINQVEGLISAGDLKAIPENRTFLKPGFFSRTKSSILSIDAAMLKMETVFDWLDGGKFGMFKRIVFQRIVDAQERRRKMTRRMVDALEKAQAEVPKEVRKRWGQKISLPFIDPRNGRQAVMTRDQLISMALNLGNEGNAAKLAGGYGWAEQSMLDMLNQELTPAEWAYVQKVWDIVDTLWPDISALERRINGVEPDKIEAREIQTNAGTLRGGYFPVDYDKSRDLRVEKLSALDADRLFSNGYKRASTRAGSTNERTEIRDMPILLSPSVLSRHISEIVHDVTHREALMDAHRFLNDPRIVTAVREVMGEEIQKQFNPWLHHISNELAYEAQGLGGFEKALKTLRVNATFTGLAFRWSTVAMQLSGFVQTAEVVGPTAMAKGVFSYAQHPVDSFGFVLERSQEVASRMETMDRDMRDMLSNDSGLGKAVSDIRAAGFMAIGAVDRFVSVVSWMAAYNKSLETGAAEDVAIAYADEVIRKSQGSGAAKDLAAMVRGKGVAGEAMKMIAPFYSFMSAYYQRQRNFARDTGRAFRKRDAAAIPGLVTRFLLLYVFPALAAEWLAGRWPDDDDEESFTQWALQTMGLNALGPLPVVRDLANVAVKDFDSSVSSVDRFVSTASRTIKDMKRIADGEDTKRATRNAMEVAGYLGAPTSGQMAATTQFLVDVYGGDQHPENFGDWWEGLRTGRIKDE